MKRIEFTLSMPSRASWNGQWSGEGKHYAIVRALPDAKADELLKEKSWYYSWSDGWGALVCVRELKKGELAKKSAGFYGYDWMVDSILIRGEILAAHEVRAIERSERERNKTALAQRISEAMASTIARMEQLSAEEEVGAP